MKIIDESYFESLTNYQESIEKHIFTTDESLLNDYLSCLRHFTVEGAIDLNVKVKRNKRGMLVVTKTYTTARENYKMGL